MKNTKKIILYVFWTSLLIGTVSVVLAIWNVEPDVILKKVFATSFVTGCVSLLSIILLKRL